MISGIFLKYTFCWVVEQKIGDVLGALGFLMHTTACGALLHHDVCGVLWLTVCQKHPDTHSQS